MQLTEIETNRLKKYFKDALTFITDLEARQFEKKFTSKEHIIENACKEMNVTFEELLTLRKRYYIVRKQILMTLLIEHTNLGVTDIGKIFGRDHSTVIYARKTIYDLTFSDPEVKELFYRVKSVIQEDKILKIA